MKATLSRRLAAEFVGTAFLVAAVVGSGIMAERLSGGNVALALLANTIATGAALVALILTFGPISGAHFNPVVSQRTVANIRRVRRNVRSVVCDLGVLAVECQSRPFCGWGLHHGCILVHRFHIFCKPGGHYRKITERYLRRNPTCGCPAFHCCSASRRARGDVLVSLAGAGIAIVRRACAYPAQRRREALNRDRLNHDN